MSNSKIARQKAVTPPAGFRYRNGMSRSGLALIYAFAGYAIGVWFLTCPNWAINLVGVLLLAHALVVSAYLIHECTHGALFARPAANDAMGTALTWLSGACVASYQGVKEKHLRHHADRLDVVTFDYRAVLASWPAISRRAVLALEWAYIPAVEFLMRALIVVAQFTDGTARDKTRVCLILGARALAFVALGVFCLKAVILYAVAYILFLHVLRFEDAFQHTFDVYATRSLTPAPAAMVRDRAYEHANTYSDVVSLHVPWANLLILNFAYHNAHHARPASPWHELPRLHAALYGKDDRQVLPVRMLLASYHRYRVARVLATDYGSVAPAGDRARDFLGAVGVSFLTAI